MSALAAESTLLSVDALHVHFPTGPGGFFGGVRETVKAVDGVTFDVRAGETLGLVGESGCGKSTTGRAMLRLTPVTSGTVTFNGKVLGSLSNEAMRQERQRLQIVFQDPFASLNPRHTIGGIITEPLRVHGMTSKRARLARAQELLGLVGVASNALERYPHEFSGGQRQRIGIARALATNPAFVVLDEPVSALDVSIQSQILHLLLDLQQRLGLTYLFIAHDLAVVGQMSDRVIVMYLGQIVEMASSADMFQQPLHPYTLALLSAVPYPDPEVQRTHRRIILSGEVPSPIHPPSGCRFHTRCPIASDRCRSEVPALRTMATGHTVACHYAESSQEQMAAATAGMAQAERGFPATTSDEGRR